MSVEGHSTILTEPLAWLPEEKRKDIPHNTSALLKLITN